MELGSMTKLESLDLSNNKLNGSIPTFIGDCIHLFQLNLSKNKFGLNIPIEIGKITQLNVLDLSYNLLVGDISPPLANLKVLANLNLSHNGLSGRIPKEAESLTGLQDVVLSYNKLEGPIPNNKAFMNASLEGNKGLCGNVTGLQPWDRPSFVVKKHSMAKGRKVIIITVLPVMGALLLLCVFIGILFMCNKKRRVRDVERRDGDGWLSISMLDGKALYRDILNASEEFDAKFCIGQEGHESVYKVNLPSLGNIAVKRLHSSYQNTHPKSFMNEVRALTGIKHRNIVNLYGYCSKAQHSLLVYEYVEMGSLSKFAYTMKVTQMCDVYSFGVLSLEIIKGKHLGEYITVLENSSTIDHEQLSDLLDERLPYPEDRVKEVLIFIIKLACSCLLETPKSRPTMHFISHKLSSMDARPHTRVKRVL
ncbi:hypothetical protein H5410_041554 [Solanum commersonii]|uniref:non-specific serine/threonine protein kinase n=1 Tax=Solanum commersonii TaxID=4109 RepID=A0A9J5XV28_SOLCO|nr:hypothetical protein H5410_041554 [Solanum commersonii]